MIAGAMPSSCPKCHQELPEGSACCAGLEYRWQCTDCGKVVSGLAVPHGTCLACGGPVQVVKGYELEDPMTVRPIRTAVQFELNSYHFYRLACDRTEDPELRSIFERLCRHEVEHLRRLETRYHAHLDESLLELQPPEDELLADSLFAGLAPEPSDDAASIYDLALEMEERTRKHFQSLARILPPGAEQEICQELVSEEEEHIALLQGERAQFVARKA